MNTERFNIYEVEDFVVDDEFIQLVYNTDSATKIKEFTILFPDKMDEINIAASILKALNVKTLRQSSQRKKELWEAVINEMKNDISFFY